MPRTCCLILLAFFALTNHAAATSVNNIAFYYGHEAPIGALYGYDWVVLQQSQTTDARLDLLKQSSTRPISYLSVGEIAKSHRYFREVPEAWKLGVNAAWKSSVLDLRNPDVRNFLLERLVAPAMARGFSGLFMDTLDSHLLTTEGNAAPEDFALGQAELIKDIRQRYPGILLIINRGFHLPEVVHGMVDALAFESWRGGYDAARDRYTSVSDSDRDWLAGQIAHWRDAHPGIPLIAIDYVRDIASAANHAAQLRSEGFIPYVSNGALNRLAPTYPETVKRHVLVFHDLPSDNMDRSAAHRRLGIVLERLGLVPVYRSALEPPPREPAQDRFAGVVLWWETGNRHPEICRWLTAHQSPDLPVVTFGLAPAQSDCQSLLGGSRATSPAVPLTFDRQHSSVLNYEGGRLPVSRPDLLPTESGGEPWLIATGSNGEVYHPVYTFTKGGAAITPFVLETGPGDQAFWLFDPFEFLRAALKLRSFPAVDTTTESGRRILTAHIDGDGFVSRAELPGSPLAAQVIGERIIERFAIPHTVSVIEAEVSPKGLYPKASAEAEALARRQFRLGHVEVASHTYSHPFFWGAIEGGDAPRLEYTLYGYAMTIPGYHATPEREITGSVDYINRALAPTQKPVSVFLWTGDARPGQQSLAMVRELGLVNVNGGDTHPLPYDSGVAGVWPDARPLGDELQVYAPVMNENVFTNLWTGPFYGFRNVTDSFKILEERGRLKPIGIYYHYYSGTKPESLSALEEVYRYALAQEVTPLFLSDYARRVQSHYYSALRVDEDGGFTWRGLHHPTTARIDLSLYPDLDRSTGVAGFNDASGQRFVHLSGTDVQLYLGDTPSPGPYLRSANASINSWRRNRTRSGWQIAADFAGHQPLEVVIAGASDCKQTGGPTLQRHKNSRGMVFSSQTRHGGPLELECR